MAANLRGSPTVRVGVVGPGNVGSGLLCNLAEMPSVSGVLVAGRRDDRALAAILDAASLAPQAAGKFRVARFAELREADVVVLACGAPLRVGQTTHELHQGNAAIARGVLEAVKFNPEAVVIVVTGPVDDITVLVQECCGLPTSQVMGFGGDLDRNRLEYVLRARQRPADGALVVGEHGADAIPVYDDAADYEVVAREVRTFVGRISKAGPLRNLASGILLGRLVGAVAADANRVHHVSAYHPAHGLDLTWPCRIGRSGVVALEDVQVRGAALDDLERLIAKRKARSALIDHQE